MSVVSSLILTLHTELLGADGLGIAVAAFVLASFAILLLTMNMALFYTLMIDCCHTNDELKFWLREISWRIYLPYQLWTLGVWSSTVTFFLYLFTITTVEIAASICGGIMFLWLMWHMQLTYALKALYNMKEKFASRN